MDYQNEYDLMIEKILDKLDLATGLKIQYLNMYNYEDKDYKILEIETDRKYFLDTLKEKGLTEELKNKVYEYCLDAVDTYTKFMNNFVEMGTIDNIDSTQRILALKAKLDKFKKELSEFNITVK